MTGELLMIRDPLVSIIIPVYNVESYLEEALDSVVNQTYEKLEILVIDDGSTDGSGIICDKYAERDERIRLIHQENKGLSAARNAGLDRMTGEVCAFLDPDDAYHITFVEKLLAAMIREEADVAVCKYTDQQTVGKLGLNGEQSRPFGDSGNYDRIQGLRALADSTINISVWNKLYRKELWQEIRYPEGYVYEDIDTSFRIFDICQRIYVLDEPLYLHRKRPESITTTISMKSIHDRNLACEHFASFIALNTPEIFTPSQERKWRQSSFNGMIISYINNTNGTGQEIIAFREELGKQILMTGKETDMKTFGFRTRIAWHMFRTCPWLLKAAYPVYRPFRLLAFKTTGR